MSTSTNRIALWSIEEKGDAVKNEGGELSIDAKAAQEILDEYVRSFQKRNPNLYLFNAVLHMDEATPHLHLDYIPVAHGYKTKMHTRNSLTKALQEMGIESATSKLDNETMHWQKRERDFLMGICRERGLEVEVIGEKRDNYTIPEYKAARQAADELTAELEILNAERQEVEAAIASINLAAENSREEVAESKQHLAEINAEIDEREKRYAVYEKKIAELKPSLKGMGIQSIQLVLLSVYTVQARRVKRSCGTIMNIQLMLLLIVLLNLSVSIKYWLFSFPGYSEAL